MARIARIPHHVTQRGSRGERLSFGDDDVAVNRDWLAESRRIVPSGVVPNRKRRPRSRNKVFDESQRNTASSEFPTRPGGLEGLLGPGADREVDRRSPGLRIRRLAVSTARWCADSRRALDTVAARVLRHIQIHITHFMISKSAQ